MKKRILASMLATLCVASVGLSGCDLLTKTEYAVPEVSINNGELVFTYPDGTTQNVGVVKGADGKDGVNGTNGTNGKDGASGVGVESAAINEKGELVLTYTDGTEENLGVVKGADGEDGKNGLNGKDGSKITIGENGHFYIDGEDTFYVAGERDVIKIDPYGKKFTDETQETLTIRNVEATDNVFDVEKVKYSNERNSIKYDENGEISSFRIYTQDINEVYAFYESITKAEDCPFLGLLMSLDTTGLSCFNTTYHFYYNANIDRMGFGSTIMTGVIQLWDGREYEIRFQMDSRFSLGHFSDTEYYKVPAKYICYDDKAFLTESIMKISKKSFYTGDYSGTFRNWGLSYKSKNENNPYEDELLKIFGYNNTEPELAYYYYESAIEVKDAPEDTDNGKLTDDEMALVFGHIYELIKDRFVVYDYDYYKIQFEEDVMGNE